MIAEKPELFVDSFAAKKDDLSPNHVEEVAFTLFPELREVAREMKEEKLATRVL